MKLWKITKIMENDEKKGNVKDDDTRLRELNSLFKRNNIRIILEVSEDEETEKRSEGLCEQIIAVNFPYLGKDIDIKIQ